MITDSAFLTPEGHEKLNEELQYLVTERRREVAALIQDAKDAGDVSDNAAYDEAKEQQAFVEGRIRHLEDILARAEIIEHAETADAVILGCEVTVAEDGADPEHFRLVGSAEADPTQGSISNESPLGRALLGKGVGDKATIRTPDGGTLTFRILGIA